MKIDLRYPIILAGIIVAAVVPIYLCLAVGLSLGWTLVEAREPAVFAGLPLSVPCVACGIYLSGEWLKNSAPIWLALWEEAE